MAFQIPPPPFVVGLNLPAAMRRWPIARGRLKTADLIPYLFASVPFALFAGLTYLIIPATHEFGRRGAATVMGGGAAISAAIPLLVIYRWVVACPVCENGFAPSLPAHAHQCAHCGLEFGADESVTPATPWGAGDV